MSGLLNSTHVPQVADVSVELTKNKAVIREQDLLVLYLLVVTYHLVPLGKCTSVLVAGVVSQFLESNGYGQ